MTSSSVSFCGPIKRSFTVKVLAIIRLGLKFAVPAPLLIVCVMGKLKLLESCSRGMTAYFSNMTIEKVASLACFMLGNVFLFMAVFGPWKYYFPMTLSYIAALIVTEDREH